MGQPSAVAGMHFGGDTYDAERDRDRLAGQIFRVWVCMADQQWRTLQDISYATNDPEPSISARLRDFRKKRFGSHVVEREYIDRGLFRYRLVINVEGMV